MDVFKNIFSLTYSQIAKLNDKDLWKYVDKYTHPLCYSCSCFHICSLADWQECEHILNMTNDNSYYY